ncbi:MAG: hypothetical protein ACKOPE_05425 [Novosphingobium sp.]
MAIAFALILAAAAPLQVAATPASPGGVRATAMATVEIVRAETSSPQAAPGATARKVRTGAGQSAVEFE